MKLMEITLVVLGTVGFGVLVAFFLAGGLCLVENMLWSRICARPRFKRWFYVAGHIMMTAGFLWGAYVFVAAYREFKHG